MNRPSAEPIHSPNSLALPDQRLDPVPHLLQLASSEQPAARLAALQDLARLGALAAEAIPTLCGLLADNDAAVRKATARALGNMGPAAVSSLSDALAHSDKEVRREAVWALGRMGQRAAGAIPALCQALCDADARTASGAAQAFANIGPGAIAAIPDLIHSLQRANLVLCRLAARALSVIGPPALPALLEKLDDPDPYVRREITIAIGFMEARAKPAAGALMRKLRALSPSGPAANVPVSQDPLLTRVTPVAALDASVEDDRILIIRTLARIGASGEAREYLQTLLNDPDQGVRRAASQATMHMLGW